ncbi:MAG: hypothetical protein ACRDD4_06240 [Culicoidibacterales bacterium]
MDKKEINGIDFIDRINIIEKTYYEIKKTKELFADFPKEIKYATNEIQENSYHELSNTVRIAEKTLLIDCYTVAEQMLKNAKYQLLNYDDDEKSSIQKFLEYKISPRNFSPNAKSEEVNKFFKRYESSNLFVCPLKNYDNMIIARHQYAHSGKYQFDFEIIPNLIEILLYLEFEYRMFLGNTEWCQFFLEIKKCKKNIGNNEAGIQLNYQNKLPEFKKIVKKIEDITKTEKNSVAKDFSDIIRLVETDTNFKQIEKKIDEMKKNLREKYK